MAGLSAASVAAIAELGLGSGIRFDEDMVPALNAVGIQPQPDQPYVFNDARSKGFYMPTTREHVKRSLSTLDLTDAEVIERVLRFAKRIAELYEASRDPDRAKLVRLRLALADDGYTIDTDTQGEGDMARVSIDKRAIAQYMKQMQEEFDKHPIRIPVTTDPAAPGAPTPQTTIYNGPVFHGDANGAQLAWGNQTVNQNQQRTEQIAPGFEAIAAAVAEALKGLPAVGLPEEDEQDATAAANEVLAEVTQSNPDRGKIRAALARVRDTSRRSPWPGPPAQRRVCTTGRKQPWSSSQPSRSERLRRVSPAAPLDVSEADFLDLGPAKLVGSSCCRKEHWPHQDPRRCR